MSRHASLKKGFTVVELLVVIVVIGILATLVFVGYKGISNKAVDNGVTSDIDNVDTAETNYTLKHAGVPKAWYSGTTTTDSDLAVTPVSGNVVDVVANTTDYCIRIYNPSASTYKTLATAATKESTPGACTTLPASAQAIADAGSSGGNGGSGNQFTTLTWTQRTSAGSRVWSAVASSADGTKLAATEYNGYIYTSTDSGATWTQRASSRAWASIASSDDGAKLVAVDGSSGGYIYTSTDYGATWTQRASSGGSYLYSVTSSADGAKLAAALYDANTPLVSTDYGATWSSWDYSTFVGWNQIASSSDGSTLVAHSDNYDNPSVYVSTNAGSTWATTLSEAGSTGTYTGVSVISGDGTLILAGMGNGDIYTSSNKGVSYIKRTSPYSGEWNYASSSSDGSKLVLLSWDTSDVYVSKDSGVTWESGGDSVSQNANTWAGVASSSDGAKLVAVDGGPWGSSTGGYIYTGTYN